MRKTAPQLKVRIFPFSFETLLEALNTVYAGFVKTKSKLTGREVECLSFLRGHFSSSIGRATATKLFSSASGDT